MDKITKAIRFIFFFLFLGLFFTAKAEENNYSRLNYLEELIKQKAVFVSDSFDITTTYVALGMATLLMNDSSEEKQIQGYELLDQIATLTEEKIKNKVITADTKEVDMILKLLGHHKYFIDIPVSDTEKLVYYAKEGRFGYILQRGHDRGVYKYFAIMLALSVLSVWFFYKKINTNSDV